MVKQKQEPIIFESEDSLWQMMASGERSFDMRRWDLSDHRIYRLSGGHWERPEDTLGRPSVDITIGPAPASSPIGRLPEWVADEPFISFRNKYTGELLVCRYGGMEFTDWAPGWVFLIFTGIIRRVLPPMKPKPPK